MKAGRMGRAERIVAACLAAIWCAAGLAALAMGLWLRPGIMPVVLGLLAIAYGWVWSRVALSGERRRWPVWKK
jgi:hypothetical protein